MNSNIEVMLIGGDCDGQLISVPGDRAYVTLPKRFTLSVTVPPPHTEELTYTRGTENYRRHDITICGERFTLFVHERLNLAQAMRRMMAFYVEQHV